MKIACWRREEHELEWSILILSMEETSVVCGQPLSSKVKAAYSVTMNIFRKKKYFLFKSFAKVA